MSDFINTVFVSTLWNRKDHYGRSTCKYHLDKECAINSINIPHRKSGLSKNRENCVVEIGFRVAINQGLSRCKKCQNAGAIT